MFSVIDFTRGGVPYQIHDVRPMLTLNDDVSNSVSLTVSVALPIAVGAYDQTETDFGQRSPVTEARNVSATGRCDCADTKKCFSI